MTDRDQSTYHRNRQRAARRKRACIWCGEPRARGRSRCQACIDSARERYQALRELGVCTKCGGDSGGHWACVECRQRDADRKRAARS